MIFQKKVWSFDGLLGSQINLMAFLDFKSVILSLIFNIWKCDNWDFFNIATWFFIFYFLFIEYWKNSIFKKKKKKGVCTISTFQVQKVNYGLSLVIKWSSCKSSHSWKLFTKSLDSRSVSILDVNSISLL